MGESAWSASTKYICFSTSLSGLPSAAPAGDTCLKDAAAGMPVAFLRAFTSCHELNASQKLM